MQGLGKGREGSEGLKQTARRRGLLSHERGRSGYVAFMKQRTLIYSLLAGGLLVPAFARGDRVDDYIQDEMASHRIPGVALMIIRDGKPIKTAAYGVANLELNVPVKPETVFEIGSITKQFTAAGILLLAQDGKLSVDDKISAHLPNVPSAWTNITIRHLLTHTSGIKSYTGLDGFQLTKHLTQAQFINAIGRGADGFCARRVVEVLQHGVQPAGLRH